MHHWPQAVATLECPLTPLRAEKKSSPRPKSTLSCWPAVSLPRNWPQRPSRRAITLLRTLRTLAIMRWPSSAFWPSTISQVALIAVTWTRIAGDASSRPITSSSKDLERVGVALLALQALELSRVVPIVSLTTLESSCAR